MNFDPRRFKPDPSSDPRREGRLTWEAWLIGALLGAAYLLAARALFSG